MKVIDHSVLENNWMKLTEWMNPLAEGVNEQMKHRRASKQNKVITLVKTKQSWIIKEIQP